MSMEQKEMFFTDPVEMMKQMPNVNFPAGEEYKNGFRTLMQTYYLDTIAKFGTSGTTCDGIMNELLLGGLAGRVRSEENGKWANWVSPNEDEHRCAFVFNPQLLTKYQQYVASSLSQAYYKSYLKCRGHLAEE